MAISGYAYPDHSIPVLDYSKLEWTGVKRWREDGKYLIQTYRGNRFSLQPNATASTDPMTEVLVFSYYGGYKLYFRYRLIVTIGTLSDVYTLTSQIVLKNHRGEEVSVTGGPGGNRTKTPIDNIPCQEWYFVPGHFIYSTNNPTIVGEAPVQVAFGAFYEKSQEIYPNAIGFTEEAIYNQFVQQWGETLWLPCDNDELFNTRKALWTSSGADDPFVPGGGGGEGDDPTPSDPGGGDRPDDDPGDDIPIPGLPAVSVFSTGLISAYVMTTTQLNTLATELWSSNFVNSIEKLMNDPFEAIIGLNLLPLNLGASGSDVPIVIGNYTCDTAVGKKITTQFYKISCKAREIPLRWKNFLDYDDSSLSIFLPFIGMKHLDPDDVLGKTLTIEYHIDALTGGGTCFILCNSAVLYEYPCNVAYSIPLTGANKAELYKGLLDVAMTAAIGGVTKGVGGAIAGGALGAGKALTGKQSDVDRGGSLAGNTGITGHLQAYVILHSPALALPGSFREIKGYKSNLTRQLALCQGFTKVSAVNLAVPGANAAELEEIETLLKTGVLI